MKRQPMKSSCLELRIKAVSCATDGDRRLNFQFIIHKFLYQRKKVEDNLRDSCGEGRGESSSADVKS